MLIPPCERDRFTCESDGCTAGAGHNAAAIGGDPHAAPACSFHR